MISYETLCATVHPGKQELKGLEMIELCDTYLHDTVRLISFAFLLGFQRGQLADPKEGK